MLASYEYNTAKPAILTRLRYCRAFLMAQLVQNPPVIQGTQEMRVQSLDREDPLEEGVAAHSSILAWRIPWTEEPGGYSLRVAKSQTRVSTQHEHVLNSGVLFVFQ